jgi:hypothetical protein
MTFSTVAPEKVAPGGRRGPHWVAIYRTRIGFNHVVLPLWAESTSREEAIEYAKTHIPA